MKQTDCFKSEYYYFLDVTALTEIVKELVLMNKDTQQAIVKAIEETCVTCGGPHPYYECLATGGNTFDSQNYNQNRYNQNQGNYQAPNNQGFNQQRGQNFNQGNNNYQALNYQAPNNQAQVGPSNELSNYMKKHEPKLITDQVPTESTIRVPPPVVQSPPTHSFYELPKRNPHQPPIPYPSRLNKDKVQDKSDIHVHKLLQMFRKLYFNISLAEALVLMPKYHTMLKELLSNKEKLLGLANTSLTENCSTVLLKKLPKKLRDPGRFLIPCDFYRLESCMALADLGDSINLMPLFVWKKLSLPDLTPTHMTLKLATRSIAYSVGIAEDVFVQVGKFTFLADFVVVDYDVVPRVPFILGRHFLRMAHALVDVHREELILRDGDEKLIFHADSTPKHPHKHGNESINMINFIDITCEDCFPEVLKFKKLNHPSSGSTTPLSDSFPNLTPFETNDSLIEEFTDEIALLEPFPPRNEDENFNFEADLRKLNIYDDDNNDDLFDLKSDNDEWKQLLYGDCYKDIDSMKDKNKDSEINLLVVEDHIVESNDLLPRLLDNDSTLPEESSEIATLSLSPFGNEDKVFNPGILILGRTQMFNDESKDKDYKVNTSSEALSILEERNFLSISCYQKLLFFLELTVIETLLSFSSKNKDKVFDPGILVSKGVHYLTLELSHRTYETFKIINVHLNIFSEGPIKIFPFFCFCPKDKGIWGESRNSHKNKRFLGGNPCLYFLFLFSNKCVERRLAFSFLVFRGLCFMSRIASDYEDSCARGFVHCLLELQSLA
nr:reverse transcriptase domain-containing protein [Tanacetum cinerariifolium]